MDKDKPPSVWSVIGDCVPDKLNQTLAIFSQLTKESLVSFKDSVLSFLRTPLNNIPLVGNSNLMVTTELNATVYQAVYSSMDELNVTGWNQTATHSFGNRFADRLMMNLELEILNKLWLNSETQGNDLDFFHSLPLKDETLFVALVCMAIIVPIIFITLFIIFFHNRQQKNRERSHEMLLREQPETATEELKVVRQLSDDPPDLDLKMAPV